jgi:transcriptional regulator of aromatic amino acid metabolism
LLLQLFNKKFLFFVLFQDPALKLRVGQLYIRHYKAIMIDFISDDQEVDVSITNLSVQILTVPSIAHNLVETYNAFSHMMKYFNEIFEEQVEYVDDALNLEQWVEDQKNEYERAENILTDLQYVLSVAPTTWTQEMRKNFIEGTKSFIWLICRLQVSKFQHKVHGRLVGLRFVSFEFRAN